MTDDPHYITPEYALTLLDQFVDSACGRSNWCKQHNVSNQYLSDVLCKKIGIDGKIARAIGLKKVVMYERRGE